MHLSLPIATPTAPYTDASPKWPFVFPSGRRTREISKYRGKFHTFLCAVRSVIIIFIIIIIL